MPQKYINILKKSLTPYGIDIIKPFNVSDYNNLCQNHQSLTPISQFGRENALGLLIGNTKAIWPPFVEHYKNDLILKKIQNPLDKYVEIAIFKASSELPTQSEVWFSFHGNENFVSMLHVAEISGLAKISPAQLAVNSEHGFWFGLRAVLVIDIDANIQITQAEPCIGCHAPCKDLYDKTIGLSGEARIQGWIDIRKCCPLGKNTPYSENQINYHHRKTRDFIETS